jgi:hypothetical protein
MIGREKKKLGRKNERWIERKKIDRKMSGNESMIEREKIERKLSGNRAIIDRSLSNFQ